MKSALITLLFLLIPTGITLAQQRTGFSNPDDTQQLLDYRLPDWGYSNFLLNVSSGGRLFKSVNKNSGDNLEEERQEINVSINPEYELYRESEKRIFELYGNATFDYGNNKDEYSADNSINEVRSYHSALDIVAELREYISSNTFLLAEEELGLVYNSFSREEHIDESLTEDREELERIFVSDTQLGIGIGRVRNVSPVIRALRLKERYGVLANSNQLSNEEVANAADILTRYDGYQQRYDRPEKHFWQAMDKATNGSFRNLQPFDMLYLTDVLDESIGRRLEGWELAGGAKFDYGNSLNRIDTPLQTPSFERSLNINKRAGAFIKGRWFKNLSLNHQISFTADANRTYPLGSNSNTLTKWNTSVRAEASWLWNVTDRFLMNTRLMNLYDTYKNEASEYFDERRYWYNRSQLSSNFTYFIENRLAFNVAVRYSLYYSSLGSSPEIFDQRNRQLSFTAGLKYYFSRNLY